MENEDEFDFERFERLLARRQAHMDQCSTHLTDTWPPILWSMFRKLEEQGFNEDQALQLTIAWLTGTLTSGAGR